MKNTLVSVLVMIAMLITTIGAASYKTYAATSPDQASAEVVEANNEVNTEANTEVGSESGMDVKIDANLKATYDCFFYNAGWSSSWTADNRNLSRTGTYPTAVKAGLSGQPQGMSGTIVYQVNLSSKGWLDKAENGASTGDEEGDKPLEAIRVWLTGELAEHFDIYTRVLESGSWTSWVKNGDTAGHEGVGTHIDGICISITAKDAGEPAEISQGSVDPTKPMIALTFDDGPNASVTNRILASLEAVGGHATFFMVGNRVHGANATCVARMVADGCEVGNHTYSHVYLTKLSAGGIHETINQTNAAIAAACGVTPKVVRPPGGYYNASSNAALAQVGEPAIMWSLDTRDWKTRNTQSTIDSVLNNVKDGDIVLMHDLYEATGAAAEVIIPELVARGYQLVTVSEMGAARGGIQPGQVYNSFR